MSRDTNTDKPNTNKKVKDPANKTQQENNKSEDSEAILECDTCGKPYKSKGFLRNHKYEHKKEDILNDIKDQCEEKVLQCMKKTAPETLIILMTAWIVLMNPSLMICLQCDKNDKLKFLIRRHVEMHIVIVGSTFDC